MIGRFGRVAYVALVTSIALFPEPSIAAGGPGWNVVEAADGGTCGAATDGSVLIATPDGRQYGIIVSDVTLGDRPERDIRVDGAQVPFKWAQIRTTAFTPLDDAGLAKVAAARTVEFQWPERTISLPTAGLSAALTKLKICGETIKARRVATASPPPPAEAGPPTRADGPLMLSLECDGQGAWVAAGSVSSGIPGVRDSDVAYRSGGQGRVRLNCGPDGNTVSFPATFPRHVTGRPIKLSDVDVNPDRIVAKARGLLGSATVLTVDRRSGDVNLELGGVSFSGACWKVDQAAAARKF